MKKICKFLSIFLIFSMTLSGLVEASSLVGEKQLNKKNMDLVKLVDGEDKAEIAVAVSQDIYRDGSKNVVLLAWDGEVDALSGSLLAKEKDAPLLFTKKNYLLKTTREEIERLKAETIYILGGENIVSRDLEIQLGKDYLVKRISGANRVSTSIEIAKELYDNREGVFLTTGYGEKLADVFSITPVSARDNIPILLTRENEIPKETKKALKDLGVKQVTIVGGERAIAAKVEEELKEDFSVRRVQASSREKTSLAIAKEYFKEVEDLIITHGYKESYALLAAYLAGKINSPVLLRDKADLSFEIKEYIKDHSLKSIRLFGNELENHKVLEDIELTIKGKEEESIGDSKPKPRPEAKPEPEPDSKPDPKPEDKPTPEPELKPETDPETEEELESEEPEVDSEVQPEPEKPEIEPDPESNPEKEEDLEEEDKEQPAPENLTTSSPSGEGIKDGKIMGVTSQMEYKLDGEESFISIEGEEVKDLQSGIYQVRFKAKEGYKAGDIAEVIVYSNMDKFVIVDGMITEYSGSSSNLIIPAYVIRDGIEMEINRIRDGVFEDNEKLESIILPNSITFIGNKAFLNCKSLETIELPNSLASISIKTFEACKKLKTIKIPNSVKAIKAYAFRGCSSLETIAIPDSVKTIEGSAFRACSRLKTFTIGQGVNIAKNIFDFTEKDELYNLYNPLRKAGTYIYEKKIWSIVDDNE